MVRSTAPKMWQSLALLGQTVIGPPCQSWAWVSEIEVVDQCHGLGVVAEKGSRPLERAGGLGSRGIDAAFRVGIEERFCPQ